MDAPKTVLVPTRLGPLSITRHGADGPGLVLWHSLFLDGRSWDPVLPALTPGRTTLVVDGPCHGASPGPDRLFSLDECGDAALEILDHFRLTEVDWIGNAWGGHVGVVLAARAPARIRTLAALSSPMQALRPLERIRLGALVGVFGITGWTPWLVGAVVDALVLPSASSDTKRYVADAVQRPDPAAMHRAIRSVALGRPSLVERLPSITAPTFLLTSPRDATWPPDLARDQVRHLRRGRLEVLDQVCHVPPMEAPSAVAALLSTWIAAR
jgi:pimeloyl-ACP methyl ester carboxylesterase